MVYGTLYHDFCHDLAKLMQASLALAAPKVQVYGTLFHDFYHDSAKLMQASLALAAPKVQVYVTSFHDFCHDLAKLMQALLCTRCSKSSSSCLQSYNIFQSDARNSLFFNQIGMKAMRM